MTNLSPAAQALLDAWWNSSDGEYVDGVWTPNRSVQLAAALEAAADKGRLKPKHWQGSAPDDRENGWNEAMAWLEKIAAELRGFTTTTDTP